MTAAERNVPPTSSAASSRCRTLHPRVLSGILLILLFVVQLKWPPAIGGNPNSPFDLIDYLIQPALTLGLVMTASVARLSRSALLSALTQELRAHRRAIGL